MILMYALKTPLSAQCAGVLSTEHSVQSNPSALSALSTEMHHQNKTLSTKCCHPHGHSVLSTSTVCAPGPPQYINTSQYIQQRPNTIYRIGCQLLRIANTNIYLDTSVLIPVLSEHYQ